VLPTRTARRIAAGTNGRAFEWFADGLGARRTGSPSRLTCTRTMNLSRRGGEISRRLEGLWARARRFKVSERESRGRVSAVQTSTPGQSGCVAERTEQPLIGGA